MPDTTINPANNAEVAQAAPGEEPIIQLSQIDKFYGDYQALTDVSADIAPGEFFSLLGPSGCGKTTLLRTIAGFEDVSAGTVTIAGRDMAGVPANRRPTNMVFQSYAIFPHMTVAENVAFGLVARRMDKAQIAPKVDAALTQVGLGGYGGRASHALSGGQRQRVALARALVLQPQVLLLDEPLSALDKKLREQMQGELRSLQREVGITFILVTHDQEEALTMSDRIAVMFEGRIAQLAAPQVLYRRPVNRQVADFIGVMNFLETTVNPAGNGYELDIAGLGRVEIPAEQAPGGRGDLVGVRPELLTILGDTDDAARVAEGAVAELSYYGDMTYYGVRLDGMAAPVTISMRNAAGMLERRVGDRVRVGWSPESVLLLR